MKPTYEELVKSLTDALNFIEHSQANSGKLSNAEEWNKNVEEYRQNVSSVGIGRCYLPEAEVDLAKIRDQLKRAVE